LLAEYVLTKIIWAPAQNSLTRTQIMRLSIITKCLNSTLSDFGPVLDESQRQIVQVQCFEEEYSQINVVLFFLRHEFSDGVQGEDNLNVFKPVRVFLSDGIQIKRREWKSPANLFTTERYLKPAFSLALMIFTLK
jgi:hypothetical protein